MSNAFPLAWPDGVPRAKYRNTSKFKMVTVAECIKELRRQTGLLSASGLVISTNIPLRMDGDPCSNPGRMQDPGAAIYFQMKKRPYCLPCDSWNTVEENLWAVGKHIDAMRGMVRWGVGSIEQQFEGFKRIESQISRAWWDVLEVNRQCSREIIIANYRRVARDRHPDQGGSESAMQELNLARDTAFREVAA